MLKLSSENPELFHQVAHFESNQRFPVQDNSFPIKFKHWRENKVCVVIVLE